MKQNNLFFKNSLRMLFMLFVFYALTPCAIKTALYQTFEVNYSKPILVSKTTFQNDSCSNQIAENCITKEVNDVKFQLTTTPLSLPVFFEELVSYKTAYLKNPNSLLGNTPPFYILFKRLKIYLS